MPITKQELLLCINKRRSGSGGAHSPCGTGGTGGTGCAVRPGGTGRTGGAHFARCAGIALIARHTLNALWSGGTSGACRTGGAFRPGGSGGPGRSGGALSRTLGTGWSGGSCWTGKNGGFHGRA